MKAFSVSTLALAVLALSFVACDNKNSGNTNAPASQNGGGTQLKGVSESNWQAVIKANFGLDIAVPQGWAFKSVNSPNGVNNLELMMTGGEGTTKDEEGKRLFEATKAISPHGNYKNNANWEAETVSAGDAINDYSEADTFKDDDANANWSFTFGSKKIMVVYMARGNWAQYTFVINSM